MNKYGIYIVFLAIIIAVLPLDAYASDISEAEWQGVIRITNDGESVTNVSVNCSANSISYDFMNSSANDVVIQYYRSDVTFMPGYDDNPWSIFIDSIDTNHNIDYDIYTTGVSGGRIRYFPGDGGMTVNDHASMEQSGNYTPSGTIASG